MIFGGTHAIKERGHAKNAIESSLKESGVCIHYSRDEHPCLKSPWSDIRALLNINGFNTNILFTTTESFR